MRRYGVVIANDVDADLRIWEAPACVLLGFVKAGGPTTYTLLSLSFALGCRILHHDVFGASVVPSSLVLEIKIYPRCLECRTGHAHSI